MSKFGCIVMGPAGAGKSTFCAALIQHLRYNKRSSIYINLDPAAEEFAFKPDIDIKDLVSLEDVMEELDLGPNGGLLKCFEYLLENMDFLTDPLADVEEDYLIIIDMPGQIELYTHVPIVPNIVRELTQGFLNMRLCAAYLMESTFMIDKSKFFAGTLSAMSAMMLLELPHVNILSKMDLMRGRMSRRELKRFIDPDVYLMDDEVDTGDDATRFPSDRQSASSIPRAREQTFARLNEAVARLIDDYGMVSYLRLDVQKEKSINAVLSYIDECIQFHDAQEPREPMDEDLEEPEES